MRTERVGFAVSGSFCTHEQVLKALEQLAAVYETVIPIASEASAFTDTRFGTSEELLERLEDLTGQEVLCDKSHLRNGRPVVVAVSSNDGLAAGARNIGELLVRKNYYFVPFGQDNAAAKPCSLVADFGKIPETVDAALRGEQLQPVLLR